MAITKRGICRDSSMLRSYSGPKKKESSCNHPKDEQTRVKSSSSQSASLRLHIHEMDPLCRSRVKNAAFFSDTEVDGDGDFSKQFSKGGWPEDENCLWLSSATLSPSSFSDDYELSNLLDFPLDAWFISLLSVSANSPSVTGEVQIFFDGSKVNPIEEASLVLDQKMSKDDQMISQDKLKEEEVVMWLLRTTGSESIDSCVTCLENAWPSCGQPVKEQSSFQDTSQLSPINIPPLISYIADARSEKDYLQSGFPSQSSPSCCSSEIETSSRSDSSVTELDDLSSAFCPSDGSIHASDVFDMEDFATDRTLFWPSDWKPDWGSEAKWELFAMSPRKNNYNVGIPERTFPESLGLRVHKGKMNREKECKRRLLFGPGSNSSKFLELRCTTGNKEIRRMTTMPSRLRKSTKNCMKVVPLDLEDEPAEEAVSSEKPKIMYKQLLDEDFESNELPIEAMLGLDEFDGHEGVDSEFNKDDFSLEEAL